MTQDQLDRLSLTISYLSLRENNEPLHQTNIDAETARIERMVEYEYKIEPSGKLHLIDFSIHFLKENYYEIIYGTKYLNDYLSDVIDNDFAYDD